MPIPHLKLTAINRATGGSAAACLAYAMGWGRYHHKADGVLAHGRAGPDLGGWGRIDLAERRKDAKVARTVVIALPCELPRAPWSSWSLSTRRTCASGLAWPSAGPSMPPATGVIRGTFTST